MPIVDVEVVMGAGSGALPEAALVANTLGAVLGSAPGRTWVRLRSLDAACYAENGVAAPAPVFVTVLLATLPDPAAMDAQVAALTQAVAALFGRAADNVHVEYAPAAAGRMAFGGKPVR